MIDPPSGAEVVWTSPDLERVVDYFTNTLGFHIALVFPADDPRETVVVGHGLRLRLCRGEATGGLTVRVPAARITDASRAQQDAPPGVRLELDPEPWPVRLPESRPVFARSPHAAGAGNPGRAGMLYRDLIPGRQGGRYIASQISIPQGGAVPDYVHFHEVHFQMIYCHRGWVRVVYEDQGPPFVMEAGDCVLQPPGIRHRVLESSPGLEVIELSSPAEHVTRADPELDLPTPSLLPGRVFHGQRFLWFRAASAGAVSRSSHPGFAATSLEMADATAGVAAAHHLRALPEDNRGGAGADTAGAGADTAGDPVGVWRHDADLLFYFVRAGSGALRCEGQGRFVLQPDDAVVIPPETAYAWSDPSADFELLEIMLPAGGRRVHADESFLR